MTREPTVIVSLRRIVLTREPDYLDPIMGRPTDKKRGLYVDSGKAGDVLAVYDALTTPKLRAELVGLPIPLMVRLAREVLRLAREYRRNGQEGGMRSCAAT